MRKSATKGGELYMSLGSRKLEVEPVDKCGAPDAYYVPLSEEVALLKAALLEKRGSNMATTLVPGPYDVPEEVDENLSIRR
jgi:hypothetical protein